MRPMLEVADIVRRHGPAYRQTHAAHLGRTERRVLAAIEGKRGYRTLSGLLDAQSLFAVAQCHGMSSSMRLCGQPLTSRVSRSVR